MVGPPYYGPRPYGPYPPPGTPLPEDPKDEARARLIIIALAIAYFIGGIVLIGVLYYLVVLMSGLGAVTLDMKTVFIAPFMYFLFGGLLLYLWPRRDRVIGMVETAFDGKSGR